MMRRMKQAKKWLAIVPLALLSITMAGTPALTNTVHAAAVQSFSDVPADHWAYQAVGKLAKAGLIDGYNDKAFKGDRTLSRYEFAIVVAKAIDKLEKADETNQKLIDKLSIEFATELNRLGARVAKVESKTNTWVSGETRVRYFGNEPKAPGTTKLHGSDSFDFRQRIKFQGTINDDISWMARLSASSKFGNYNNGTDGSNASFDLLAVTAKNVIGIDKVRIGRFPYDNFTHGLFGKAIGVDGIRIDEGFGNVTFTGSVNNIKGNGIATNISGPASASGDANTLTTAQLSGKANDNLGWKAGYYWSDVSGTSTADGKGSLNTRTGSFSQSKGWAAGFDAKLGGVMLIGDYVSTQLQGASNLPTSPKGWSVELSSATKQPPIYFSGKYLVDAKKAGDFGWSVSYRSVDAGAIPSGAGGFDAQAVSYPAEAYSTLGKGTDNVKGLYVAFQSTVSKNVIWTIEGQDLKIKNSSLTGFENLGKTYMTKFEFFY
ncbi:S-layer homology domain-containing protein [Sporomusa sp.]|uniref:S-layer homology domain-containing protein n=1 Tax=Sporomusa sp. TaxID=2078658 RepID=UPI002CB9F44C|nr:S-layer homology domain-containing protein [Sporomusa sp.]HWR42314.1 S-layer homology domain-containing protein [Sporomusa sp.]